MRLDSLFQLVSHLASHKNGQLISSVWGNTSAEAWRKEDREMAPLLLCCREKIQTPNPLLLLILARHWNLTTPQNNQIQRGWWPSSEGLLQRLWILADIILCFSKHYSPLPGICLGRFLAVTHLLCAHNKDLQTTSMWFFPLKRLGILYIVINNKNRFPNPFPSLWYTWNYSPALEFSCRENEFAH